MMTIKHKMHSKDESIKYILETEDGHFFECIYMPHGEDGIVLCLSSQIGCVNKCNHCATGKVDYIRDLSSAEICDEVRVMLSDNEYDGSIKIAILFMGMGEPFLNFENVIDSINRMNNEFRIKDEDITISTVGIPSMIRKFSKMRRKIRLAVSLHATNDEIRNRIIPLNKIYGISEILEMIKEYNDLDLRPILLQYTLIGGVNDKNEDAEGLALIASNYNCEVRLIPFNPAPSVSFMETTDERIEAFCRVLLSNSIPYVVSRSRGIDVSGGCGQLYLYGA